MKRFLKYKYTVYGILTDIIIISSVLFFNTNVARVLGFYWLDTCVMLFYFMLYWKWTGRIKYYFDVVISSMMIILINCIYFPFVFVVAGAVHYNVSFDNPLAIFYPYYDVGFFVLVSGIAHYKFFSKTAELFLQGADMEYFTDINCAYSMFLLPVAVVLSVVPMLLTGNPTLSVLLTFIFLRDRMDYWRYKKINSSLEALLASANKATNP